MHRRETASLFDHFVRADHEGQRHVDAERFGGFEVDDQLESRRLLDGEIGGFGALEDLVYIHRAASKQVVDVRAIGEETAAATRLLRRREVR